MKKNKPSSSKQKPGLSFSEKKRIAEAKYGTSDVRPQDTDTDMLRTARRTNTNVHPAFPEGYSENLTASIQGLFDFPLVSLPEFRMDAVLLQDQLSQTQEVFKSIKPPAGGFQVLGVDFEFHQEFTYDGFICVASVSSQQRTIVVDCLYENRRFAIDWMKRMLEGKRTLKVFCGCANDVFRLQKDWNCFAKGVVDIQDLFVVWKSQQYDDCLNTCKSAIIKRNQQRGRASTAVSIEKYLSDLIMPGLGFLMEAIFPNSPINKDDIPSLADWRNRPLHQELVKYAAIDSNYALRLFYFLYGKVGRNGLQEAMRMTCTKLLNRSALPRYKDNVVSTESSQWVVEQVYKFRTFLALNFDKKPEQVIPSSILPKLASELEAAGLDVDAIGKILGKYETTRVFVKGAKLLSAYLEPSGKMLEEMRSMRCRNCNKLGHVAKFCVEYPDTEAKRDFRSRPENADKNRIQYERRRENWCKKRGLNPQDTVCPWEKQ